MEHKGEIRDVLAEVGPRLKRLRTHRGTTLTALATRTGISKSTLSRLETGQRKPSLELLLPLADAFQVPLDELVGAPEVGDPRIRFKPRTRNGRLVFPLTQGTTGLAVWKVVIPPERERNLRTHDGYEWLYVLSGQMRLILGEHDITMGPGEVAEFDTRMPHWFGPADDEPVEILSVHGSHGKRMHVAPRRATRIRSAQRGFPKTATEVAHHAWLSHFRRHGAHPVLPDIERTAGHVRARDSDTAQHIIGLCAEGRPDRVVLR